MAALPITVSLLALMLALPMTWALAQAPMAALPVMGVPMAEPVAARPQDRVQDPQLRQALQDLENQAASGAPAERARAAWLLGLIHLHGAGVGQAPALADNWFEMAQTLGEPWAPAGLAWCELEGCQGTANPAAARRWVLALRRFNLPRAQYLEWLLDSRLAPLQVATPQRWPGTAPPTPPTSPLLRQAAQGGDIHAMIELGLQSVAAQQLPEALGHFEDAAPRSAVAVNNALLVRERLQAQRDATRAQPMEAEALLAAARRSHRGEGVPANYVEAIRLYQLAKLRGSVEAQKMLALIYSRPTATGELDVAWMQQLANLDLSGATPRPASGATSRSLQREPSPLVDLLPPVWRERMAALPR